MKNFPGRDARGSVAKSRVGGSRSGNRNGDGGFALRKFIVEYFYRKLQQSPRGGSGIAANRRRATGNGRNLDGANVRSGIHESTSVVARSARNFKGGRLAMRQKTGAGIASDSISNNKGIEFGAITGSPPGCFRSEAGGQKENSQEKN